MIIATAFDYRLSIIISTYVIYHEFKTCIGDYYYFIVVVCHF